MINKKKKGNSPRSPEGEPHRGLSEEEIRREESKLKEKKGPPLKFEKEEYEEAVGPVKEKAREALETHKLSDYEKSVIDAYVAGWKKDLKEASAREREKILGGAEKYLEGSTEGRKNRKLFEVRLEELLGERNKFLEAAMEVTEHDPKRLGLTREQLEGLKEDFRLRYDDHPKKKEWPLPIRLVTVSTQREQITNIMKKGAEKEGERRKAA